MTLGSLQLAAGQGHGGGVGTGRRSHPFASWALDCLVEAEGEGSWGLCWHLQRPKAAASVDTEEALGSRRVLSSGSVFGLSSWLQPPMSPFWCRGFLGA